MLENGLQELAPLLCHNLLSNNAVRDVVHMRVSVDDPGGNVDSLVLLLGAQNEVGVRGVICQVHGVLDCRLLATSESTGTLNKGFNLGGMLVKF